MTTTNHPKVFKLIVIECDKIVDVVRVSFGDYGDLYQRMLQKGIDLLFPDTKIEVQLTKYNAVDNGNYPDPRDFDGMIVSGSRHDAFSDVPWMVSLVEYIRKVLTDRSIRLYGSCFGHQIIARAAGARVARSPTDWELAVTEFELTKEGVAIFGQPSVSIHQFHRDEVLDVPEGFLLLGGNKWCRIQGLWCPDRGALSLQAHPEFSGAVVAKILDYRYAQGRFDQSVYDDAMSRTTHAWDENVVPLAIAKFLTETWKERGGPQQEVVRPNL